MTSPSGAIFAKGVEEDCRGARELIITFAVDVGERWIVIG